MRITFAYPVDVDGKTYDPDQTVELADEQARPLIDAGRARVAAEKTDKAAAAASTAKGETR